MKRFSPVFSPVWTSVVLMVAVSGLSGEGLTGADVLLVPPSARSAALGEADISRCAELDAAGLNPAGPAGMEGRRFLFSHIEWLADIKYEYAAYGQSLLGGTVFLLMAYLHQADFQDFDLEGVEGGTLKAGDFSFQAGYGRRFGKVSAGATMRLLNRTLASYQSTTFAGDIGAVFRTEFFKLYREGDGENLGLGLSVQNLGPGVKFVGESFPLPLAIRAGIGYRLAQNLNHALYLWGAYAYLPMDRLSTAHAGLEYGFRGKGFLRLGYSGGEGGEGKMTFGLGGRHTYRGAVLALDLGFMPDSVFGTTWFWTFGAAF